MNEHDEALRDAKRKIAELEVELDRARRERNRALVAQRFAEQVAVTRERQLREFIETWTPPAELEKAS